MRPLLIIPTNNIWCRVMNPGKCAQACEISVSCYIDEIPPLIETELVRLYQTLHSSLPYFKTFRSLEQANSYVEQCNGYPCSVLLFTIRNRRIDVLNEMIEIDQAALDRFARYVFAIFDRADIIRFKAVKTEACGFAYPMQKHKSKDTYFISLPATPQEYTRSMGKSTRTGVRYQTNNVLRNFPSFSSFSSVNKDINEEHVREIIRFSEHKINAKGGKFAHDTQRILALAKMCGFVHVLLINGRVCAGSINYCIGSSYFGEVTAYDPQYEKYGLGKLCVHQTICESIMRGGAKFYLGGGTFEFKQRMLGVILSMDEVHIYRSSGRMLRHLDKAAATFVLGLFRQLKRALQRRQKTPWARVVFRVANFFRDRG